MAVHAKKMELLYLSKSGRLVYSGGPTETYQSASLPFYSGASHRDLPEC